MYSMRQKKLPIPFTVCPFRSNGILAKTDRTVYPFRSLLPFRHSRWSLANADELES